MKLDEFNTIMDKDDIARAMGYEWFEDLSLEEQMYIHHRTAEIWISLKAPELDLAPSKSK